MRSNLILFSLVLVLLVAGMIFVNRWLIRIIRPRESGSRLLVYFVIVLLFGFLVTFLFSHLMLTMLFQRR